jgi:IMP dehydrogenase
MAKFIDEPSRTFSEYLLLPGYSSKECIPDKVSLKTPVTKYRKAEEEPAISLNIPLVSAVMQSVSDDRMAVALAKEGGLSFIYASQPIEKEAEMIKRVKSYKAGFVKSDSNIRPDQTLADILALKKRTGHSTVAVTDDGTPDGKVLGIVTSRDYRVSRMSLDTKVEEFMTPFYSLIYAEEGITLSEANDILWDNKLNALPIIDKNGRLTHFVFRKDYEMHKENPNELLDEHKRYMVGAGINTRDYKERVPALLDAGADVLCIDSSEGYSEWQRETLDYIRKNFGDQVKVGAGNVVDQESFLFLAKAGADFVKVGIGGGSICITREQKGIGRGQATAVIDVADYIIPFTICHELSHFKGFMREDEANFIAYLACNSSDSAEFKYSGKLNALIYTLRALNDHATVSEYMAVYDLIPDQIKAEIIYNNLYWYERTTPVTTMAKAANDQYLQANAQADGVSSYGRIVDLLLAEYADQINNAVLL